MEIEGQENDRHEEPSPSTGFAQLWSQWQLLDSVLPTGGFAHSFGLESAAQARLVVLPEDLQTYVIHVLENTGSLLLPFIYAITISPDEQTWHKLDKFLNATLTNDVSRKASMSQGSALMRVAAAVFSEIPLLKILRSSALATGVIAFHHAPIFGLVCALLGFGPEISQRAYMFVTMRDIISAATRLNLVGPLGAAVLQHRFAPVAEELSKKMDESGRRRGVSGVPFAGSCAGVPWILVFKTLLFLMFCLSCHLHYVFCGKAYSTSARDTLYAYMLAGLNNSTVLMLETHTNLWARGNDTTSEILTEARLSLVENDKRRTRFVYEIHSRRPREAKDNGTRS